jgi:hypothetical protein
VIMVFLFSFDLKMVALQKHDSHSANWRSVLLLKFKS